MDGWIDGLFKRGYEKGPLVQHQMVSFTCLCCLSVLDGQGE